MALVLGSVPAHLEHDLGEGAVVAYCGRVPVLVDGACRSGDALVPSACNDGVAHVLGRGGNNACSQ